MNRKGSDLKVNQVPPQLAYIRAMQRADKEGKRVFFRMEQREVTDYGTVD